MRRTPPPIDLRALAAFVTVCETGSMTAAAKRIGVSQSAISQAITALEREQGTVLFDRDSRPPRPNIAGRALLELARPLLEHAQMVSARVGDASAAGRLPVRLGCVDSFAATVGPELIRAVSGTARQITMWSGLTPGLSKQLHDRELDVAVCTQTTLSDARIVEMPLFSEAFVAVVARGHLAGRPKVDWRVLASELPLIRYTGRSVIGQQVERYARHLGIDSPRRFEFDATDPLLSLVAARLGFAISTPLCLWQARHYLDEIEVLPLPSGRLGRRDFFLLHRQDEWDDFVREIVTLTRAVIDRSIRPSLERALPHLPDDALL
ncbi:LysR family transcriptional regulator [Burkholderia stagnalis]|uniref:LysR family transcriptional regulator n=1 Tax=Burkholderia stagnalis TaxID=1503054 RepID=A0A3N7WDX3_9BURK|nr:LysR family transcriptional regulator [Burkholderia stagnalis]KAB0633785.1 LysR family transcriptional regulator [Burkholderia stagnalis]KVL88692.1 LysR family transcriptional regulator [Burkholderia stagnalis]KVL97111.1 LysR family transcriptional regulator [Burkholderia stagnalis]KVM17699.1 LysR family transcriptional regulator [Burkholderia stagnalis]KVN14838.1 LysR family transcriptional regulator [Burkholderia stagnalis]